MAQQLTPLAGLEEGLGPAPYQVANNCLQLHFQRIWLCSGILGTCICVHTSRQAHAHELIFFKAQDLAVLS